jgi:pentatricopeptide repeat protein
MFVLCAAACRVCRAALISAYGKSGQLDKALSVFRDMKRLGAERNVITYSSLISACEKAGRWQLALQLFDEMHREAILPSVVTFNSLIAACAQGACWASQCSKPCSCGGTAPPPPKKSNVTITETNRTHSVVFSMQNRTLGPCSAAIRVILIIVVEDEPRH